MEKKLYGNYTRMAWAKLNKYWRQHPTKQELYRHLPTITKTIQVNRNRHSGNCWRSKNELISNRILWTPSYGREKAGQPVRTYIQQLYADTGWSLNDYPGAMDDREGWRDRVREIRVRSATWWWWWWYSKNVGIMVTVWLMDREPGVQLQVELYQRIKK